jgi:hypothetical protein
VAYAVLSLGAAVARADIAIHALVIGNNQPYVAPGARTAQASPETSDVGGPVLSPLRFADDDAAAFYELISAVAGDVHLLTVMDRETQALYPSLDAVARPPTLGELRSALAAVRRAIDEDHARGIASALFVFFSGHGSAGERGGPVLALLDGGITRELLYDEILAQQSADYVHLFVDACHAEAVVRPRDADARAVPVRDADAETFLVRDTLSRFPRVGAIVAAASDAQAHEWDPLAHGVFTYELLSALRGAADVNRDGRIEYSEIYAFLAAANRGVEDRRVRLSVVAHPPAVAPRVAVLDLARFRGTKMARLVDVPAQTGLVEIEAGDGRRLVSLHGEQGSTTDLLVPAGATIYVRTGTKEARLDPAPGAILAWEQLRFREPEGRGRGALADAMRRGLFASTFGRGYYTGFIDQAPEFVPVSFRADAVARKVAPHETASAIGAAGNAAGDERGLASWGRADDRIMIGVGASMAVTRSLGVAEGLRLGFRPGGREGWLVSVDGYRAAMADFSEWQATGSAGWVLTGRLGPARGWVSAAVGGGVVELSARNASARWSALGEAGPAIGAAANVTRHLGLWIEAQVFALVYRQEDRTALSVAPSLWIGTYVGH